MKNKMKTKNILGIFGIMFLVLAFAPFVSASLDLDLMDNNWNDINNGQFTYNQGDTFGVIVEASSFGENINQVSLRMIGPSTTYTIPVNTNSLPDQIWGDAATINTVSYTPGTYILEFKVIGSANTDTASVTIIITGPNNSPVIISTADTSVNENTAYSYDVDATDADADTLSYSATGLPSGISIDSVTGLISGTAPTVSADTPYNVIVTVLDGNGGTDTQSFILTVLDVSTSPIPIITINDPVNGNIYTSNAPTEIDFTVTDADGDLNNCWVDDGTTTSTPISCALSNLVSGLVPVQGLNTWTVYADDLAGNVGSATVTFTINDLTGPVITAINPLNDEVLDYTDVTLSISTDEFATVDYSLEDSSGNVLFSGSMTETSSLQFESALLNLEDDEEYTVTYTATDVMGTSATLIITFSIDEEVSSSSSPGDSYFSTEDLEGSISIGDQIDLTNDDPNTDLNWWQRFINWLCRLFGLEEIY